MIIFAQHLSKAEQNYQKKKLYECCFLEASNMKPEGEVQLILGTFASTSDIKKPHQAE